MKYIIKKEIIIELISFLLTLLFLYAAGSKLAEYNKFIGQMGKSPLLTDFAPTLAWLVPSIEIAICALLASRYRLLGLYASFGLMSLFTIYIFSILSFSEELPCSCGGIISKFGWTEHLIFNIFFIIISGFGVLIFENKAYPESKELVNTAQ